MAVSLRLIGNISSCTNSRYIEIFYMNGLLNALEVGCHKHKSADIDRDLCWLISNIVACGNDSMTIAVFNTPFFVEKMKEVLVSSNVT
jgi:hypothetical protein